MTEGAFSAPLILCVLLVEHFFLIDEAFLEVAAAVAVAVATTAT